jgi:hypothetical protein
MESNNFDEILNQLELINSKLDDATLETNKYINDFDKLKEIIDEKLPNTEDNGDEKQLKTENNVNNDKMEIDN